MDMDRRAVVKSAALGAAIATPKLANAFECSPAEIDVETGACPVPKNDVDKPKVSLAPLIQIFDHRGCPRPRVEYKGKASGDDNDQMLVKVMMIDVDKSYTVAGIPAYKQRRQAMYGWKYQDLLFTGYNGKFKPLQAGDPGVDPNDPTPWRPKTRQLREKLENAYKEATGITLPSEGAAGAEGPSA
jgi:hypothetical protein